MVDISGEYRTDPLMQKVQLGIDVEYFISKNRVGVYLVECAHKCRVEALEALSSIDPADTEKIRAMQMAAQIPALFHDWLNIAINEGLNAEAAIKAEELENF